MSEPRKRLHIKTYGCQMNVYDSTRMADVMKPFGYVPYDSVEGADMVILNTCHIREKAAEKVYSDLGRIRPFKDAKAETGQSMTLVVAGCVGQAEGEEIFKRAPFVDIVVGPQSYHTLPNLLQDVEEKHTKHAINLSFVEEKKFDLLPENDTEQEMAAFLSIQEGCDKFCAFCVVPYTRGAEFSRPVHAVYREALNLVANGTVEITLLGQNVNAYHGEQSDGGTCSLSQLIRHLSGIPGLERIRYTTSHPRDMDEDLIAVHGEESKLMPYLHLPIQAGSDNILKKMNRKHTTEEYLKIIEKLRQARPDIALSSDFIVGFPGETDQDFEDTLQLVREVRYAQAYSFKYSPRPGTPAAMQEEQAPEEVKSERLQRLQALLNEHQAEFNQQTVGQTFNVLFEKHGKHPGQLVGRSPYMQSVHIQDAPADYLNRIIPVTVTKAFPNSVAAIAALKENAA